MREPLPLHLVDAFTDRPFAGNPAAVCLLDEPRDAAWMQAVAAELNLSETAFVEAAADGFRLRWFTPTTEVDLCGHATLAAAHVLWETGRLEARAEACFDTRSGRLRAVPGARGIELDFPAVPAVPAPAPAPLVAALGLDAREVFRSRMDYLVALDDEAAVRELRPDFARLREVRTRGVIVTARAQAAPCDFVSRFFAPAAGIDEDPVTGSAHCTLAPWWGERLGKRSMRAYQASARGGVVELELRGDRVALGGRAVTVLSGVLHA